jgi:hypothetical protein
MVVPFLSFRPGGGELLLVPPTDSGVFRLLGAGVDGRDSTVKLVLGSVNGEL